MVGPPTQLPLPGIPAPWESGGTAEDPASVLSPSPSLSVMVAAGRPCPGFVAGSGEERGQDSIPGRGRGVPWGRQVWPPSSRAWPAHTAVCLLHPFFPSGNSALVP